MATYTIKINENTKAGKSLITFLKSLKEVVSVSEIKSSPAIDEALEDVRKGNTFTAKNSSDLFNQCLT
jgi:hypothetical protein